MLPKHFFLEARLQRDQSINGSQEALLPQSRTKFTLLLFLKTCSTHSNVPPAMWFWQSRDEPGSAQYERFVHKRQWQ
jgi:hypothetical protein